MTPKWFWVRVPLQLFVIKKANQKLHALSTVKRCREFKQNKLISCFIKNFSLATGRWYGCFAQEPPWISWIISTENADTLLQTNILLNFNELLESLPELSIHKTYINYLMVEVCKYLHGSSPELMTDIFTLRKNPYKVCNIRLFGSENPRSVRSGVDPITFHPS